MDADSVSYMMCHERLLTNDEYDVITSAPNDLKMNCLLLHCVKMMDIFKFQQFCNILKDLGSQKRIGECLETCKCLYICACTHESVLNVCATDTG